MAVTTIAHMNALTRPKKMMASTSAVKRILRLMVSHITKDTMFMPNMPAVIVKGLSDIGEKRG